MSTSFLYGENGPIATITLNRPEVLNALTFDTYTDLRDRLRELGENRAVRVLVLGGAGRAFCSGGDVKEIIGRLQGRSDEELLDFTRLTCEVVLLLRQMPQIVIASLNGVTAGAGAALALASDFRIASTSLRMAFLFVKVGLSGADMGAAHLLPRLIGHGRATELLMRGDFIDAATALSWGLVSRVVQPEELSRTTDEWADALARGPRLGLEMTKNIMNRSLGLGLADALEIEAEAQAVCMKHPDFDEAYRAFLEKRPPRFAR